MPQAQTFEELEVWQKARELVRLVYLHSSKGAFAKDFGLRDQLRRASVSIVSNIAEGFERGGNKEFIHFLYLAKGSTGEVRAQLYLALDLSYLSTDDFAILTKEVVVVSRQLSNFIKYLNNCAPIRIQTLQKSPNLTPNHSIT